MTIWVVETTPGQFNCHEASNLIITPHGALVGGASWAMCDEVATVGRVSFAYADGAWCSVQTEADYMGRQKVLTDLAAKRVQK